MKNKPIIENSKLGIFISVNDNEHGQLFEVQIDRIKALELLKCGDVMTIETEDDFTELYYCNKEYKLESNSMYYYFNEK